jgi:integrase
MHVALTDQHVANLLADRGDAIEIPDHSTLGLVLQARRGEADWLIVTPGLSAASLRVRFGSWPQISVAQARRIAQVLGPGLQAVANDEPTALTVATLIERYAARRLKDLKKGAATERVIRRTLGRFGDRPVEGLTRRELGGVIDDLSDRAPVAANRALSDMKTMFNWAIGRGYIDVNPAGSLRRPATERPRERTPSLDEIGEIWRGADQMRGPYGFIVQLLTLTAVRRAEVAAMRIDDLFLPQVEGAGWWTIPSHRSKNRRALRVPLTPLAHRVLTAAIDARRHPGPLIFSPTGSTPFDGWSRQKRRLDEIIAQSRAAAHKPPIPAWTLHDLRRTFATHSCDDLAIAPGVADRCLNHVGCATRSAVSRVYGRSELFDQRREALEKWAELVARSAAKPAN